MCATLSAMRGFGGYLVRQGLWKRSTRCHVGWQGPKVTPYSRLPKRLDHGHVEAMWRGSRGAMANYSAHLWVTVLAMLYGEWAAPRGAGTAESGTF